MNDPNADTDPADPLVPDPRFASFLEWQLRTELRRAGRFGDARGGAPGRSSGWRIALLLAVATTLGAACAVAVQEARRSDEREAQSRRAALLAEQAQIARDLAEVRLESLRARLAEVEQLAQAGAVPGSEAATLRDAVARDEIEVALAVLELEETRASGLAADDDVGAPRVSGRDFAGERLRLRLDAARIDQHAADRALAEAEPLAAQSLVATHEIERLLAEAQKAARQTKWWERLLRLRNDFLGGAIDADTARALAWLDRVQGLIEDRRAELGQAVQWSEELSRLRDLGYTSGDEQRRARLEVSERQADLDSAEAELELLREWLRARPDSQSQRLLQEIGRLDDGRRLLEQLGYIEFAASDGSSRR